jgi:uncharacterized integral membrane protein
LIGSGPWDREFDQGNRICCEDPRTAADLLGLDLEEEDTAMTSPYRRRKPSLIRNLWVYRHLIAIAFVLGVLLWFVVINSETVQVAFPFGMGTLTSSTGIIILLSAMAGAVLAMLAMGVLVALRRLKAGPGSADHEKEAGVLDDDLPPSDYAANAPDGFNDVPWSGGR